MKSLLKRLWKRRRRPASSSTSGQTKGDNADANMDVPVMKVLGSRIIPRSLVDTAHLSILNHCAQEDGVVVSITLRLGATPPAMEQTGKRECTRRQGLGTLFLNLDPVYKLIYAPWRSKKSPCQSHWI